MFCRLLRFCVGLRVGTIFSRWGSGRAGVLLADVCCAGAVHAGACCVCRAACVDVVCMVVGW